MADCTHAARHTERLLHAKAVMPGAAVLRRKCQQLLGPSVVPASSTHQLVQGSALCLQAVVTHDHHQQLPALGPPLSSSALTQPAG